MGQSSSLSKEASPEEAIRLFLASPPEGTPPEVIDAFGDLDTYAPLPPKLYLETVEQAPVAISITDSRATILYVNSAFERLTGYTREEVTGKNESMLSSKSTPDAVYEDLWGTIKDHRVWCGTLVNHRKDKEEYLAELTISPVMNAGGRVLYYLGMHRDISELHRLQQRLKFQVNFTEAALNAAPLVIALIGSNKQVLLDNLAYKALQGDLRGEPAEFFLDALSHQIDFSLDKLPQFTQGFRNVEVRLDPPSENEPRWFSCSGVRVSELDEAADNYFRDGQNSNCCLLLIANEITASRRRVNEARLNLIRSSMAEQQMVETMREAISGAIFKLQAPLNVIKAATAVQENGMTPHNQSIVLHQVLESGNEAMASLEAALPAVRTEHISQININEVLHEVLRLSTQEFLANGIVVDWRPTSVLRSVTGRPNALRGLFKYLLDNAIQALNESDQDHREIRLGTHLMGDEISIEVMDNGPGLDGSLRLKAFEPFFCGWKNTKGHAGMGLTMAQEVVMNHKGNIFIDDHFIGGCRLIVRLPVKAEDQE